MSEGDISNIRNYFSELLEKDLNEATVEELLECLATDNAVERIAYRKEVGSKSNKEFLHLTKGAKG